MTTMTTRYACISDRYQPEEGELYESVEEFLRMCDACHDERPELVERDGDYYEGSERILEAREVDVPREWGVGRDIVVKLRATEGERDAWDAAAEEAAQSRSEWMRDVLNGAVPMRRYVMVTDGDTWGDGWSPEQRARLCEIAEEWLTEHEGDHLSIGVREVQGNEAAGTYEVREGGDLQILGYSIPVPERVKELTDTAWEHAQGAIGDGLYVDEVYDELTVVDPAGGRWVPSDETQAEIQSADDPEATALRICRNDPMRGEWRD